MKKNIILSFTLSGHGFSGVLCINGKIIGATTLERLTREKNDIFLPISKIDLTQFGWKNEPTNYKDNLDLKFDFINDYSNINFDREEKFHLLLNYLLEMGNISLREVNCVVYSYRHIESARKFFAEKNPNIEFIVPDHHFSHACQAFLPSPFDEAAIMIVDGQGVPMERTSGDPLSGCLAYGNKNKIEVMNELSIRQSLGGIYAAFTKIIGFETNQEGKTMGLAPYGTDRYYEILKQEIKFDAKYYNIRDIKDLIKRKFEPTTDLYKLPPYSKFLKQFNRRLKTEKITDVDRDLAYAVQKITEDVMIYLADWLHAKTGSNNLCIAGGVGLNCVANYQLLVKSKFKNIFIHPNPGDNGLAVGQALYVYNILNNNDRKYVATTDSLGKKYEASVVKETINKYRNISNIVIEEFVDLKKMYESLADSISMGKITSWFQGRSEFGPRALGNRSIIADPRRKDMKDILNSRVKFRESFRPFTPSVLAERASEFFELDVESPFMLLACYVKKGKAELVPAITHVDNTARVQTVTKEINDRYYDLIKEFERKTGIPMVLETSFNINGEPIVETPEDAIKCFLSTDIDVLCIDKYLIRKII